MSKKRRVLRRIERLIGHGHVSGISFGVGWCSSEDVSMEEEEA
jgi:hypothetical protein